MADAAIGSQPVAVTIDRNSGLGWPWQSVWIPFAIFGGVLAVLLWTVLPRRMDAPAPFSIESLIHPYEAEFENSQTYLCGLIGGLLFAPPRSASWFLPLDDRAWITIQMFGFDGTLKKPVRVRHVRVPGCRPHSIPLQPGGLRPATMPFIQHCRLDVFEV
jgi:hypothetical protein